MPRNGESISQDMHSAGIRVNQRECLILSDSVLAVTRILCQTRRTAPAQKSDTRKKADVGFMPSCKTVCRLRPAEAPNRLSRCRGTRRSPEQPKNINRYISAGQEGPAITNFILPSPSRTSSSNLPQLDLRLQALLAVNSGLLTHGGLDGDD
jgi:hypothetical protein